MRIATACGDWRNGRTNNEVQVWNPKTGKKIFSLKGHSDTVLSVAFTPDGGYLASCSGRPRRNDVPGEIKIWDMQSGDEVRTLSSHKGAIYDITFNSDGTLLASASADGTVKMWAMKSVLPTTESSISEVKKSLR